LYGGLRIPTKKAIEQAESTTDRTIDSSGSGTLEKRIGVALSGDAMDTDIHGNKNK
jgi:hypothetical protein